MANYAWTTGKALPTAVNGQTFEGYNFAQKLPHTPIFTGVTGLTFRHCLLINCDLPADAVVEDCNRTHVDLCSNEHPEWVAKGLTQCAANCSHVTSSDVIQVAGVTVATVYYYADKVVA